MAINTIITDNMSETTKENKHNPVVIIKSTMPYVDVSICGREAELIQYPKPSAQEAVAPSGSGLAKEEAADVPGYNPKSKSLGAPTDGGI